MSAYDEYERVYTPVGKVAHLISVNDWANHSIPHTAGCGWWAWGKEYWRGTGSQDEYEKAKSLPVCRRCSQAAGGV
jgi:hypothetical protein